MLDKQLGAFVRGPVREFAVNALRHGHPLLNDIVRVRFASFVGYPSLGLDKCILASNSHSFSGRGGEIAGQREVFHTWRGGKIVEK